MYPSIKIAVILLSLPLFIFTMTGNQVAAYSALYWQNSIGIGKSAGVSLKDNGENGCTMTRNTPLDCGCTAEGGYSNVREFEWGIGVNWNPLAQTTLLLDYKAAPFKGSANFAYVGNNQPIRANIIANSVLVNGKLDLISLFSDSTLCVRPFVNVGIGLSALTTDQVHVNFSQRQLSKAAPSATKVIGGVEVNAIYKLGIGIEYLFNGNMGVQLSYHHVDLGKLIVDRDIGYVYGHGCAVDGAVNSPVVKPLGYNRYTDGAARVKTSVALISFWGNF